MGSADHGTCVWNGPFVGLAERIVTDRLRDLAEPPHGRFGDHSRTAHLGLLN